MIANRKGIDPVDIHIVDKDRTVFHRIQFQDDIQDGTLPLSRRPYDTGPASRFEAQIHVLKYPILL